MTINEYESKIEKLEKSVKEWRFSAILFSIGFLILFLAGMTMTNKLDAYREAEIKTSSQKTLKRKCTETIKSSVTGETLKTSEVPCLWADEKDTPKKNQ